MSQNFTWPASGGGGGGAGDASAANQVLQITQATTTNTKLTSVIGTDATAGPGKAFVIAGQQVDGTVQILETNASGHLNVADGGSSLTVDGTVAISGSVAVTGPLTDTQLRASAVPVSASSLPLPTGAATETTLAALNTKTPSLGQAANAASSPVVISSDQMSTVPAARNQSGMETTPLPQKLFRCTFASVLASSVDSTFFTTVATGSGQTIAQSAGSLVMTTATTVNSETILRSTTTFTGSTLVRAQVIASQRIANQNLFVELVDVIGDALTASASSATVLVVTIPSNPFTSANVGQSMYIGNLAGGLTGVPNRYAIASVSGNNVTFTVAGFSVTSGTCSLFGWNYHQQQFQGVTATNVAYDAQRRGWNSGQTTATINTTAAPGVMTIMASEDGNAYLADQLVASAVGTVQTATRATRVVNLPEESTALYLQIRSLNGSTAPASTTTWTIGTVSVENYTATNVSINTVKAQSTSATLPVSLATGTNTIGALTANQSVNLAQVTGSAVLTGAGPTGTGSQRTTVANVASATPANVAASATSVTIMASVASRVGGCVFNDSTATLYFKFGATASATSFTVAIPPNGYYELPQPCYSGICDGIWTAATGSARVTVW